MKQILIIDESPLFREYLKLKLNENSIETEVAVSVKDGISRMRSMIPSLIIMDYHLTRQGFMEILKSKKADPNTVNIPVIMMAGRIDQKRLIELVPFNVKKVFTKPVKIDALFATLSEIMGVHFSIDESPGIVEVHVNENIIFIEIAKGLNRDKLDLLHFKIIELIELYEIRLPKVIIMLSDMKLSFADAPNMQKLLNTVLKSTRARMNYIKVLTNDDFVRQFIKGHRDYTDIEVLSNLQHALNGLVADPGGNTADPESKADLISDRILKAKTSDAGEAVGLKFEAETKSARLELIKDSMQNMKIAVIDDDFIIQALIKNTFEKTGASIFPFSDGDEFLPTIDTASYDLAFLDLNMPRVDGFSVLRALQTRDIRYPVIVLSSIVQREAMIKAIKMGVKSYLVKPLKPEDIFRKSIEILKTSF